MDGRFLLLLPIAFGAGIVTAVSPCVFPVLPILFAGGASGGSRPPDAGIPRPPAGVWGLSLLSTGRPAAAPCVFPVLPILSAGGASGGRRRPYAIIAGLVASFAVFTLIATWLLEQLHLPQDFLRNLSIGLLFL